MTTAPLFVRTATATLITAAALGALALLQGCEEVGELVLEDSATIDASAVQSLFVSHEAGDLELLGDEEVTGITAEAQLWCSPLASHDAAVSTLTLELVDDGAGVARLSADVGLPGCWVDVHVVAPAALALEVKDGSGNIDLRQFSGGVSLVDGSGNARLEDLAGGLAITDDSGNLDVSRVAGDVVITDDSGNIHVSDVDGDVDIEDDSGNLTVERVTGVVTVRDDSGNITIADVGDFDLVSDGSGSVTVE